MNQHLYLWWSMPFRCGIVAGALTLHTISDGLIERRCDNLGNRRKSWWSDNYLLLLVLDETDFGPNRNDDVALSLRSNVFTKNNEFIEWKDRKWSLIQRNQPEPPKHGQKLANHRIVHTSVIDGDAIAFLESMGYTYSFEYIMKGYEYWLGTIQILIYRVYQVLLKALDKNSLFNSQTFILIRSRTNMPSIRQRHWAIWILVIGSCKHWFQTALKIKFLKRANCYFSWLFSYQGQWRCPLLTMH